MAKNDKVLIDGIIDEMVEQSRPSKKRDEAFEYFAFEQILKDYDLSHEEIIMGAVDGRNDGGIDGIYIMVNGHLLTDPESFKWPKSGSVLEVWLITCKHQDTFRQAPLDNLAASLIELFDFSLQDKDLKGDYSDKILRYRENLKLAYRKVSPRLTKFTVNFCYVSRGLTDDVGESIIARSEQIKSIASDAFGNIVPTFIFLGSSELVEAHRKTPNFTLELPFIDDLSSGETYIVLANLKDYFEFIQDSGKLRKYLFDSNVRDFMGLNRVNEDIRETLLDLESPDFWWLNNGVTILSTFANIVGDRIIIQDIQIVNGLQTSESIYRHFSNGGDDPRNRSVLVKVIVSKDDKVRDTIIRATNNQTQVEISALHATDKIQRDIEDVLKQNEWYYERRTNFYKNQGITSEKIVSPLYLASGFVCLLKKAPQQATKLKSKFMRLPESYEEVFSSSTDLNIWPKIAAIMKTTDWYLETKRPGTSGVGEYFLKNRRQFLAFLTICRLLRTFNFSVNDLVQFDINKYSIEELEISWDYLKSKHIENPSKSKFLFSNWTLILVDASKKWKIDGIGRFSSISNSLKRNGHSITRENTSTQIQNKEVDNSLVIKIKELLPVQPWKPGTEKKIMKQVGCTNKQYFDSVQRLIDDGHFNRQKDGVVYDDNGDVLCFDEDRVDSNTLKLKASDIETN